MTQDTLIHVATTVYEHELKQDPDVASLHYLQRRKQQINGQMEALRLEEAAIDHLIARVKNTVCPACNGNRRHWVHDSCSDGHWEPCIDCKGTGRAIVNATPAEPA